MEVCGENGKTFPSLCDLHKANVKLAYNGKCRPDECNTDHVCGSNGITYKSVCHARASFIRTDYMGKCFSQRYVSFVINIKYNGQKGKNNNNVKIISCIS